MEWKDLFPKENRYFETENGILYCGDCLEIMKKFPENSVDLVITDPPYGIKADKGVGGYGIGRYSRYEGNWDQKRPSKEVFDNILRVGRDFLIFGANYFSDLLPQMTHWIFWDKKGCYPFKNPYSDGELIGTSFSRKNTKKVVYIQQGFISQEKTKRFHPTQKPVKLIEMLLLEYSKENWLILDPFLGSGTTAVAAERLKRRWIGIEIEEKYCQIAKERISNLQQMLF